MSDIRWDSSSGDGWIAIWPSSWPTRRGYYPVYYGIWNKAVSGTAEAVKIGIGFDKPDGARVKNLFKDLALQRGCDLSSDQLVITSRDASELQARVDDGARSLLHLIQASRGTLENAFDALEGRNVGGQNIIGVVPD